MGGKRKTNGGSAAGTASGDALSMMLERLLTESTCRSHRWAMILTASWIPSEAAIGRNLDSLNIILYASSL
jgi:hypothetical protein